MPVYIKKEDADFFDNLKKAVYSKDALKVDELLKKAGQIVEEKVEAAKEIAASKDDTSRVQAELVNTVDTAFFKLKPLPSCVFYSTTVCEYM